jgi:broad specificity phosphatase PhoE
MRQETDKNKTAAAKKVRFIKPPNIFKQKVGSGGIDEALLEKSQQIINNTEFDFAPWAQQFLKELGDIVKEARANKGQDFKITKEKMIAPVMQLKANGGMFRYQLLSDVADIALQFLEAVETGNDDTLDVIVAHENTIKIILGNKLKGDGGRAGFALIKELDNACQRYFKKYGKETAQK